MSDDESSYASSHIPIQDRHGMVQQYGQVHAAWEKCALTGSALNVQWSPLICPGPANK
ncbi:hypothetical protein FRB99_003598, partial [Tulasnella sp. 403]